MNSVSRTQLRFDPLGSNRRLRVTPVVRNRATPVAVIPARLPSQLLPGFVSPAVGFVQDPAVGILAYGQGQPLPVSGPHQPGQTTGIPAHGTGFQSFFVSGATPPSHPGYFQAGIPVSQPPGQQPPQGVVVEPPKPQQFVGPNHGFSGQFSATLGPEPPAHGFVSPAGQGVPVANGTGGHPAPLPPRKPSGFVDNCLTVLRCCNITEECYRLNGGCCTGGCWDEGCCTGGCWDEGGCFSGLFSFLDQ